VSEFNGGGSSFEPRTKLVLGVVGAAGVLFTGFLRLFRVPSWASLIPVALAFLVDAGLSVVAYRSGQAARRQIEEQGRIERDQILGKHLQFWAARNGSLPIVRDVSPYEVGTSVAVGGRELFAPRPLEQSWVEAALQSRRLVLIVGPSKAGKSRLGFEAARAVYPDRRLIVPVEASSLATLLALKPALEWSDSLVWLDDLESYLGEGGLSPQLLDTLTSIPNLSILGTIRATEYDKYGPDKEVTKSIRQVFDVAKPVIHLGPFRDTKAAQSAFPDAGEEFLRAVSRYGLGAALVAGPDLVDKLMNGTDPDGVAVVRAAVDWRRCGMTSPVPEPILNRLYVVYLPTGSEATKDAFDKGLAWSRQELYPQSRVALIWMEDQGPPRTFRVDDYVVDVMDWEAGAVPPRVWRLILDDAPPASGFDLGLAAYLISTNQTDEVSARSYLDVAEAAFRIGAEAGHMKAMLSLAVLIEDSDPVDAAHWYLEAAEAGDTGAMYRLGITLADTNRDEAIRWSRLAAEAGVAEAMFSLGALLESSDRGEALLWYRRAAEAGELDAMFNLGVLLQDTDRGEALLWYRRAAEEGAPDAKFNLSVLLQDTDREEALRWLREAADDQVTEAMLNLAVLLENTDREESLLWYREAARAGDLNAMFNLASFLQGTDRDEALMWYRRAAEAGETKAMTNLGTLVQDTDLNEALLWYRRAAEAGDTNAMFNLGVVLKDTDREDALRWYRRAAEAGNTEAMTNLGFLLEDTDREDALLWYRRAAEAGNTDAMNNLGVLLEGTSREEAELWYRRAAEASEPPGSGA
jgi:TPR repeat protein